MAVTMVDCEEYQPICGNCGIALCYTLSIYDYLEQKEFWDEWNCQDCNPDYFKNWAKNKRNNHKHTLL